ncbi:MAG: CCA tRNA nucleotidyltransferase [Parcubacteria group bacterium]|nr:CCA tRNA nucleotidyltransferase [Parcubacteria group bacterium]
MSPQFPKLTAFPALASLVEEFPKTEVFLVGGATRDILLGKKITDIDLLVRNITGDELGDFLARHGRVVFAGKQFGIWKFNEIGRPRNEVYDIALPRTEFSLHKQGMYRDFTVKTNPRLPIEEDLARRDFTVNAMAYNLIDEKLIDPHNGQDDLRDKLIRSVGKAADRFQEDFSRILRAIRFSLQLGFGIEDETLATIKAMLPKINKTIDGKRALPYEVIAEEFLKSLAADPVSALKRWDVTGALAETIPELLEMKGCVQPENWHTEGDVWEHALLALAKLSSDEFKKEFNDEKPDLELVLAVLFHDIGKPYTLKTPEKDGVDRVRFDGHDEVGAKVAKEALERLRASAPPDVGVAVDAVVWMVAHHMLLVHGEPETLRPDTIERYFFSDRNPSKNFLKLLYIDGVATIGPDGLGMTVLYDRMKERIAEIQRKTGSRGLKLAKPLVSGEDIMTVLNMQAGPRVGEILQNIRAKQLSGELKSKAEALEYIKKV